jgi:hypothetical protein
MKTVIVRYRVHPDRAAENEALIRAVYEELHANGADGLRYATFKLEDGVSFLHIAETEDGHNPLPATKAFKAFQAEISERCEEPPLVSELTQVGAFRLFSAQE